MDIRKFFLQDTAVIFTSGSGYVVLGRVKSIGKKSIVLRDASERTKRLKPMQFAAFNFDFDLARIKSDNYVTMMNT